MSLAIRQVRHRFREKNIREEGRGTSIFDGEFIKEPISLHL